VSSSRSPALRWKPSWARQPGMASAPPDAGRKGEVLGFPWSSDGDAFWRHRIGAINSARVATGSDRMNKGALKKPRHTVQACDAADLRAAPGRARRCRRYHECHRQRPGQDVQDPRGVWPLSHPPGHAQVAGRSGNICRLPHVLPRLEPVDHVSQITVPAPDGRHPERPPNRSTSGEIGADWCGTPRTKCLQK
jgi:hypothetical protein